MWLKHLHHRNKVEEQRHSAQVDAPPAPPFHAIQYGRKNSHTRRRIEHSRNSQPEKIHFDLHLKA
jgi:hypothetical protein